MGPVQPNGRLDICRAPCAEDRCGMLPTLRPACQTGVNSLGPGLSLSPGMRSKGPRRHLRTGLARPIEVTCRPSPRPAIVSFGRVSRKILQVLARPIVNGVPVAVDGHREPPRGYASPSNTVCRRRNLHIRRTHRGGGRTPGALPFEKRPQRETQRLPRGTSEKFTV